MDDKIRKGAPPRCFSYIRFSSPDQMAGDSLRRQVEFSEAYAEEHGLELDTTLSLRDLGVSAYKGEHRTRGALKTFLDAINSGVIPPGSILLVESLDRLSREQVLDAFDLFKNILQNEVKIVTLTDNREYTYKSINDDPMNLMFSLLVYVRANEESKTKSLRLTEAWKHKRARASITPVTSVCPAWLRLNPKTRSFEIIKGRGELIKTIFDLYLDGYGKRKIERHFNERNIPTWGGGNGWHSSYIAKILTNRAVIGEYQPHTTVDKKRTPIGEPISDYFPHVISKVLFFQVQQRINSNPIKGGRTGKATNLFAGLARCGYCNAPMHFLDKGRPPKGFKYLVCSAANRGIGCKRVLFRYNSFESIFLSLCSQLNLSEMFPANNRKQIHSEIISLRSSIESFQGQLQDLNNKNENLLRSLETDSKPNVQNLILKKLDANENERQRINNEQDSIEKVLQNKLDILSNTQHLIEDIKTIISKLQSVSDDTTPDLRLKLRTHIRDIVSNIVIYPAGPTITEGIFRSVKTKCRRLVRRMLEDTSHDENDIVEIENRIIQRYADNLLENKCGNTRTISQLAAIEFKSGVYNIFSSRREDPSRFILRSHNDTSGQQYGDFLNFEDSASEDDWWQIIQDVYGMQIEVVLASEVKQWEQSRHCS